MFPPKYVQAAKPIARSEPSIGFGRLYDRGGWPAGVGGIGCALIVVIGPDAPDDDCRRVKTAGRVLILAHGNVTLGGGRKILDSYSLLNYLHRVIYSDRRNMTENRASPSTDLAGRWRRLCEAMLGELRPETGSWWRSGAFWLLSWVMRRRIRREAEALAAMIQGMMQEVLTALEAFQAGKIPPVAPPAACADDAEGGERRAPERAAPTRRIGVPCGRAMDATLRGNDGFGGDADGARDRDGSGERAQGTLTAADPGCGAQDSGLRRNEAYVGERGGAQTRHPCCRGGPAIVPRALMPRARSPPLARPAQPDARSGRGRMPISFRDRIYSRAHWS